MNPTLNKFTAALQKSWRADSSYVASEWTHRNPARGQCVPSSLVVQDYYGGELIRYAAESGDLREFHYCNMLPDGTIIDTTRRQYQPVVTMREHPVDLGSFRSVRDKRLADEATRARYEALKNRVSQALAEN